MNKKEYINYLENKVTRCDEFGDMKKEKWAFIQALKEARKLDCDSERQINTEVSDKHETKALHIADVVRSFSKQNLISVLEDRKNHFKPKKYYKHERERLSQAINTIKKLVPDF